MDQQEHQPLTSAEEHATEPVPEQQPQELEGLQESQDEQLYIEEMQTLAKKRAGRKRLLGVVSLVLVLSIGMGYGWNALLSWFSTAEDSKEQGQLQFNSESLNQRQDFVEAGESTTKFSPNDTDAQGNIAKSVLTSEYIAKKVMPSVVGVVVYVDSGAKKRNQVPYAEGSGVILDQNGYIITNAHVIMQESVDGGLQKPVDRIEVYLPDDTVETAILIGADAKTDLAVLKIEAENLMSATFGDSTAIQIGEMAAAVGSPTGRMLSSSYTQGVISGLHRIIPVGLTANETIECIQTDAPINPGNSGGALVNKYGEVIGINAAKISMADYEGIGFAIPVHDALPIAQSIIDKGYVAGRARIGVLISEVSVEMAEITGTMPGIRVLSLESDADAATKDIRPGDIITHMDSELIESFDDTRKLLATKQPGQEVTLTLYRYEDGKQASKTVSIVLYEDTTGKLQ